MTNRIKIPLFLLLLLFLLSPVSAHPSDPFHTRFRGCLTCGRINDLAWSPDGSMLAYSSKYGLFIYDPVSLELISQLTDAPTGNIAWSTSGALLAGFHSFEDSSAIAVWNVADGERLANFPVTTAYADFSWHPQQEMLTFSNGFALQFWDASSQEIVQALSFDLNRTDTRVARHGLIGQLAWQPQGNYLAVSTAYTQILLWNAQTETVEQRFSTIVYPSDEMEWDDSGRYILLSSPISYETFLVDTATNEITRIFNEGASVADWNPDGMQIASNVLTLTDFDMLIWTESDWNTPQTVVREEGARAHWAEIRAIAWSPDGKRIASGSWDSSVMLWEMVDEEWHYVGCLSCATITDLAWSPDNSVLVYSSTDGIFLYDPDSLEIIDQLTDQPTGQIAWNKGGNLLASYTSGETGGQITIWDVATREPIVDLPTEALEETTFSWHPQEDILAFSTGFDLLFWDATTRQTRRSALLEIEPPMMSSTQQYGLIWQVAWRPEGTHLAITTADSKLLLWNVETETVDRRYELSALPSEHLEWNPSGTYVLISGANGVRLMDIVRGQTIHLDLHDATYATWNPDGTQVASDYASDRTHYEILAWQPLDWGIIDSWSEDPGLDHRAPITAIAWSSDDEQIASGSLDGSVNVWLVNWPESE